MTTTTAVGGRLGNIIIRNLAVSRIAERNDLFVNYCDNNLMQQLGLNLFCGKTKFEHTIRLSDDNYFSIYNNENLDANLDPNGNYFQTKPITNFLFDFLHSDDIKQDIISKNPFKDRYDANNDLHIHIRLTDAEKWNPGLDYYLKTISAISNFDKLYISSDDPAHNIVQEIIKKYPNAEIAHHDVVETIQFASTCKHSILSHGSFSAVIGYLSFFSNIHYPKYEFDKIWYGDMFSIDGWNKHT